MSNLSSEHSIVKQKQTEVGNGGKPSSTTISISHLLEYEELRSRFLAKASISSEQYRVLMLIKSNWERKTQGIGVYQLCKVIKPSQPNSVISITKDKVSNLHKIGLVEIIGHGRYNCSLYAPSRLTGDLLRSLSVA